MLKVIKYDYKSVITIPIFMVGVVAIMTIICTIYAAISTRVYTVYERLSVISLIFLFIYVFVNAVVIGIMWRRSSKGIELYEMAGVSIYKVALARMLLIFIVISLFTYILMLADTILHKIIFNILAPYGSSISIDLYRFSDNNITGVFSIFSRPYSNLMLPIISGLYAAILYTTSFLFATVTRRIDSKMVSTFVLFSIATLYIIIYYYTIRIINLLTPALNLNKYGMNALVLVFTNFDSKYESIINIIFPNLLNIGAIIFFALYVVVMFSVYSIRRKIV